MRNIKLTIEYEGTAYAGWQKQKTLPTVQGTLIDAICELTGEKVELIGASRTDAGVHAKGQVANFSCNSPIPTKGLQFGLNSHLPPDIAIIGVDDAPLDFNSRRDSLGKTYVYRIYNGASRSPLNRHTSWFLPYPLNVGLMREAAAHFLGEFNFSSFRAADSDALHSIRSITSFEVVEKGDNTIEFVISGTAFLRHMIRIISGTLAAVGKGKLAPGDIPAIIEARDRKAASTTAPPEGLTLVKVHYFGGS